MAFLLAVLLSIEGFRRFPGSFTVKQFLRFKKTGDLVKKIADEKKKKKDPRPCACEIETTFGRYGTI